MNVDIDTGIFNGIRDGEQISHVWRRNPWVMSKPAGIALGLSLLVVASLLLFGASLVTSILIGIWLIAFPSILGITWYLWRMNVYVLTNLRLIDISQKSLFNRAVAEIPMEILQDVTYELKGPVQHMLNIGTVIVQTASYTEVTLDQMTDPQAIQQALLKAGEKWRADNGASRSRAVLR